MRSDPSNEIFSFIHPEKKDVEHFLCQASNMDLAARSEYFHNLFPEVESFKASVWIQDLDVRVLICNQNTWKNVQGNNIHTILDKTIYEVGECLNWPKEIADGINRSQLIVINNGTLIQQENTVEGNYEKVWITKREPIYLNNDKPLGLLAIAIPTAIKHRKVYWSANGNQVFLYMAHQQVIFSIREFAVMQDILKGKTAAQIAKEQNLSPKTIETYIMWLKIKLNCKKSRDIIALLIWHDVAKEVLMFDLCKLH